MCLASTKEVLQELKQLLQPFGPEFDGVIEPRELEALRVACEDAAKAFEETEKRNGLCPRSLSC